MVRFLTLAVVALLCPSAQAQQCQELPVLYIVQDKSGSMDATPSGGAVSPSTPSKWAIASQVVAQTTSQFANRFRFGLMFYPGATTTFSCVSGTSALAVPSTAAQIAAAYASTGPGGGTPTASSLGAARAYLATVSTAAPKTVLLLTDGLPNCNLSLNPATCATTTPGCPNTSTCSGASCCGLGSKDCLDDQGSIAAAAALKAQGIKTYVVGFDQSLTQGNNKAVLDAIAAAGGTNSATVASNQTALSAALNAIAQANSTCCMNVCSQGATRCSSTGQREVCQLDSSTQCTNWVSSACQPMSVCTNGTCVSCTNQCTLGATQCTQDSERTCVSGAGGCTEWKSTKDCGYGERCGTTACTSCQACSAGASRCTSSGVEVCEWNILTGCTKWAARACSTGSTCQNGSCTACNTACTAGTKRCNGKTVETCVADPKGCTSWSTSQQCTTFCSGGACGMCGTTCTVGTKRCNGNGVETCATDVNNCSVWNTTTTCGPSEVCSNSSCVACATSCTEGSERCGANGSIETCRRAPSGCPEWAQTSSCSAPNRCEAGRCLPPCSHQCQAGAMRCVGQAPSRCEVGPSGCTIWRDESVCRSGTTCIEGFCAEPCARDEFETCLPAGTVCTGLPQGKLCLPPTFGTDGGTLLAPDAGAVAPPTSGPRPLDGGTSVPGRVGAQGAGCSCGSLAWLQGLSAASVTMRVLRKRRAHRSPPRN